MKNLALVLIFREGACAANEFTSSIAVCPAVRVKLNAETHWQSLRFGSTPIEIERFSEAANSCARIPTCARVLRVLEKVAPRPAAFVRNFSLDGYRTVFRYLGISCSQSLEFISSSFGKI